MRVYLDTCCLSRLLDDWTDPRIYEEARAVRDVLDRIMRGEWDWIAGGVLEDELAARPDAAGRTYLLGLLGKAERWVALDDAIIVRGRELQRLGFGGYDALHLACAERGAADALLTTDDQFIRRAARLPEDVRLPVQNPRTWTPKETL